MLERVARPWGDEVEHACNRAIDRMSTTEGAAHIDAWRDLVATIAPHVERWADGSWMLRRWNMRNEDSARAVLVEVLTRLSRDDYANLARYQERRAPTDGSTDPQLVAIERIARLREGDDEPEVETADHPFRAWLLRLLSYVVKDYIRQCLGWAHDGDGPSKRDLASGAARLSDAPEAGARPRFTEYVHVRRLLADVEAFAGSFPEPMQRALAHWMHGASYADIAAAIDLDGAPAAEKLVRAAKARLREHFRESALA